MQLIQKTFICSSPAQIPSGGLPIYRVGGCQASARTSHCIISAGNVPRRRRNASDSACRRAQVDQAIQSLEQQIHTAPTAEAYNLLCRADFELDAWDAGIPVCEKAVALDPHQRSLSSLAGTNLRREGGPCRVLKSRRTGKKVRVEFERAVKFDPNSWEARTDLAEFYLEAPGIVGGGEDKARAQSDLLLPSNPGMAHWVRARIAQKNKNNDAAEQEYRLAIDATHGGARAWVNLAGFYRHINRLDEMEQALRTMESRPLDRPGALMDGSQHVVSHRTQCCLWPRDWCAAIWPPGRWKNGPLLKPTTFLANYLRNKATIPAAEAEYRAALAMAHGFDRAQQGLQRLGR